MKIKVFGVIQESLGLSELPHEGDITAVQLRAELADRYPQLADLPQYAIAVDHSYVVDENLVIPAKSEVALIPPVSGG